MTVTVPETTIQTEPSYNFDAAIRRRLQPIDEMGQQANQYTQMLVQRRQDNAAQALQQSSSNNGATSYSSPTWNGDVSTRRSGLITVASQMAGTPYVYGGGGLKGATKSGQAHGNYNDVGFDCSGLMQYVYGKMGITLPRSSQQQATLGRVTNLANLRAGDMVAWGNSPGTAHHIALYAGNGYVWEAARTGTTVRKRKVSSNDRDIMGIAMDI